MLYLVPPCCTYRCYMIIYYIQKAHVLGISKWRSFPAAEKLVLMLKEFAQNDLYKSSCEWMTWKSKQILTTPFFMGRGLRNLELLSGVLNRHLFVRYWPYFLGGGGGCVYHRCNLCLHHCWWPTITASDQPSLLVTFYITVRPVETTSPEVALRKPVTQPGDRKGRGWWQNGGGQQQHPVNSRWWPEGSHCWQRCNRCGCFFLYNEKLNRDAPPNKKVLQ